MEEEHELWCAVIYCAVKDAMRKEACWQREKESAIEWIFSEDVYPISFLGLCDTLGLHSQHIRREIKKKITEGGLEYEQLATMRTRVGYRHPHQKNGRRTYVGFGRHVRGETKILACKNRGGPTQIPLL